MQSASTSGHVNTTDNDFVRSTAFGHLNSKATVAKSARLGATGHLGLAGVGVMAG
jgi:hypothetical protein